MARVKIETWKPKYCLALCSKTFKTTQEAMVYVENQNTANEKRAVCFEIPK
jgi:hypothetical protein